MIITVIAGCEIAFWIALALGLVLRYPARRSRAGYAVLASVPVIDLFLLIAVALDLNSGSSASTAHSLATFYLGFSLAYGHRMIAWADARFAHRFAGGPAPVRLHGAQYARKCWADVMRTGAACAIAAAVSALLIVWVGDSARTAALERGLGWAAVITALELVAAISYTIWPRRDRQPRLRRVSGGDR